MFAMLLLFYTVAINMYKAVPELEKIKNTVIMSKYAPHSNSDSVGNFGPF